MEDGFYHIIPVEDLKEHIGCGSYCHCQPLVDGELVMHNSYDAREFFSFEEEFENEEIFDFYSMHLVNAVARQTNH